MCICVMNIYTIEQRTKRGKINREVARGGERVREGRRGEEKGERDETSKHS